MKESDIRPEALLGRYLELSAQDATTCFAGVTRFPVACVACGEDKAELQFQKNNFDYSRCMACGTLFQSPRPPLAAFETFYRNSESSRYWASEFFPAVAEARRERIFRPRVERLAALCRARNIHPSPLVDVGAGYGIFLDEWRRQYPETELLAIEPSAALAHECRRKGFDVVENVVENVSGYGSRAGMVVCFEVLEHVHDPLAFVRTLARLVRPGGYVFVSTLCVDGFDIQMLWEKSNSIFPPHHINFISVVGFRKLLARAGLIELDVSTPGQLDVDIVRKSARREPEILAGQRFIRRIVEDEALAGPFQQFLADNCLSSHAWVIGRKPAEEDKNE